MSALTASTLNHATDSLREQPESIWPICQAERLERERAEEERFRALMMARFAEEDRLEQMNAQRRRLRVQEHCRAVEALLQQKRAMYEQQRV